MPLNSIEESITAVERGGEGGEKTNTERENKMSHEQSSVLLKLMLKGPRFFFIVLVSLAAQMMKKVPSSQTNAPPPD